MSTPVMKSANWCANCAYWAGNREIDGFFGWAEIDDFCEKGKCVNQKGYYNQMCPWNGQCPAFERHPAIKK